MVRGSLEEEKAGKAGKCDDHNYAQKRETHVCTHGEHGIDDEFLAS
jgi:hypothetical protein